MSEENTIFVGNNPNNDRCSKCDEPMFVRDDSIIDPLCDKCLNEM